MAQIINTLTEIFIWLKVFVVCVENDGYVCEVSSPRQDSDVIEFWNTAARVGSGQASHVNGKDPNA